MIKTIAYYPEDPRRFRRNLQEKRLDYDDWIIKCNSGDGIGVYHAFNATIVSHPPDDDKGRVDIIVDVTFSSKQAEAPKSLLEKISGVELIEKKN